MKKIFNIIKKCYNKFIEIINVIILNVFKMIFKIQDNYIILESEGDYSDNILAFYKYMIKNNYNDKYKLIWIVHEPKKYKKEKNVVFVSRYGSKIKIKFYYYLAVSKFMIFSHPYWLKKWRKEITTTCKDKIFDYVLCCGEKGKEIRKRIFENIDDKQILMIGIPRVDLMYEHRDCLKELIPNYKNEKMILVMETYKQSKNWKDSKNNNVSYGINVVKNIRDLQKLDEFLQKENVKIVVICKICLF